jgi:UDP-2,3-diacylglucosamine hydrolase
VAFFFVSDVHLRFDHPERDARFRAWLDRVSPGDDLVIVGDLCDFYMAARCTEEELLRCESLQALAVFTRSGGSLAIMAGNHDRWLGPFYERRLGARTITEPCDMQAHGLRIRLVHGHLLGARRPWKSYLESRAFFAAFGRVPRRLAAPLDQLLAWRNLRDLESDEERHLRVFREYAAACEDLADIVVTGHVHRALDEAGTTPRLIVLGGWHRRAGSLKIDASGASFQIEYDQAQSGTRLLAPSHFSSPPTAHSI